MRKKSIFLVVTILAIICVIAESTKLISLHHNSIDEGTSSKQFEVETFNKDAIQFEEFIQMFFADSVFQRKHVHFPLVLYYLAEQEDADDDSSVEQNTMINKNNYQILILDVHCEIKIIKDNGKEPYVIISIPDTALEAELYFKINNDTYFLNKIKITGDASPFI